MGWEYGNGINIPFRFMDPSWDTYPYIQTPAQNVFGPPQKNIPKTPSQEVFGWMELLHTKVYCRIRRIFGILKNNNMIVKTMHFGLVQLGLLHTLEVQVDH